jgi:hypothetical protein
MDGRLQSGIVQGRRGALVLSVMLQAPQTPVAPQAGPLQKKSVVSVFVTMPFFRTSFPMLEEENQPASTPQQGIAQPQRQDCASASSWALPSVFWSVFVVQTSVAPKRQATWLSLPCSLYSAYVRPARVRVPLGCARIGGFRQVVYIQRTFSPEPDVA